MDSKYGRLFTAKDVEMILLGTTAAANLVEAREVRRLSELWLDKHAERRESEDRETEYQLTFPADEPTFVLRASEVADRYDEARRAVLEWESMATWGRTHRRARNESAC